MTSPDAGLTWPLIIPASDEARWSAATPEQQQVASARAVELLHLLTGSVFGLVEQTVRPCTPAPAQPQTSTYSGRVGGRTRWVSGGQIVQGDALAALSCGCPQVCVCAGQHEVALRGPVHNIVSVIVDGVTLPADAYRVRNLRWLMRVDGQPWPVQHLDTDDRFEVTYRRGIEVPVAGQVAAGALAATYLPTSTSAACTPPAHATRITRQGVSIDSDPRTYYDAGLTGVDVVDQWICAVNPDRRRAPARVLSPDRHEPQTVR